MYPLSGMSQIYTESVEYDEMLREEAIAKFGIEHHVYRISTPQSGENEDDVELMPTEYHSLPSAIEAAKTMVRNCKTDLATGKPVECDPDEIPLYVCVNIYKDGNPEPVQYVNTY